MSDKCPLCGAAEQGRAPRSCILYECGTRIWFAGWGGRDKDELDEDMPCLRRQLAASDAQIERIRIRALEEVLREIALVHHACECRAIIEALMMEKPNDAI